MSYPINKTDSTKLLDLQDGTTNTDTGLTLIGRNFTNYGEFQNENFVRLLENFASTSDPSTNGAFSPLVGTVWYDKGGSRLRVYDGTNWTAVSERTISTTAPTSAYNKVGDQWWDTTDSQLKTWNGTSWLVVGPPYTSSQGKSGSIVETIVDTGLVSHTVVNTYTNGNLVAITSYDATFTPGTSIAGISTVQRGVNLISSSVLNGKAENSVRLDGQYGNVYARMDIDSAFTQSISVGGNVKLTNANISYTNSALVLQNNALFGNIELYVNAPSGNIKSLTINGTTGAIQTPVSPTDGNDVTNRTYVSQMVSLIDANVAALGAATNLSISTTSATLTSAITTLRLDTNANLAIVQSGINANVDALSTALASNVNIITANLATKTSDISDINAILPTLAPLDSAELIGSPTVPLAAEGSNNDLISSTQYVDRAVGVVSTDLSAQILSVQTVLSSQITSGLLLKAPIANPVFTGVPSAPTPAAGDNSTRIATTGFVTGAIASQKFNYTVSSNPPSGGNNGDFWFQIG